MQPISAPCLRTYYKASHHGGTRAIGSILWIVLHDEEAATAKSAAAWFKNPNSGGSAHLCVDDIECYRCLANQDIPWGAPGANREGFHIEQAGFAKWSAVIWKKHIRTIQRAAYKAALHAKIIEHASHQPFPIVFRDASDLSKRRKGITTHREVSKAFGGDHTDPGPFYPTSLFMYWCRRYRKELG